MNMISNLLLNSSLPHSCESTTLMELGMEILLADVQRLVNR